MITIQQEALRAALNAVTRASLKSSLPALAIVRLYTKADGTMCLSCFNGDTAARARITVVCDDDLSICVDALTLKAVIETLTGEIRLSSEGKSLLIQNGSNRTTMRLIEENIPMIGEEKVQTLATLTGSAFRSLARVLSFASPDSARPILQVFHLTITAKDIVAQAADGFSAASVQESVEGTADQVCIPLPISVAKLPAGLIDERDTVRIQTSGKDRFILQITNAENAKDLTLATMTSAENFPAEQITQFIEEARKNAVAHLKVQQSSLSQTLRMVAAMGTQNTFIKAVSGVIKMASEETQTGQAHNLVEGTASGEDTSVWLSAAFLRRAADACKGEIAIKITDNKKPVLVEQGSFVSVIMPLFMDGAKDPFPEDEALALSLPEMAMTSA